VTSDDREAESIHEPPEAAPLSSSFPSSFPHRTITHKVSFNPYAGPSWAQSSAADAEERRSLLRSEYGDSIISNHLAPGDRGEELLPEEIVFKDPNLNLAETQGAYEVSKGKRIGRLFVIFQHPFCTSRPTFRIRIHGYVPNYVAIAQVCAAVIYCLLAAGPVFGFAAIKPVFIREGVYRDQCSKEELGHGYGLCYGQETRQVTISPHRFSWLIVAV
jgi:hypothetical protein